MTITNKRPVSFGDLRDALEFVSVGTLLNTIAAIDLQTGAVILGSDDIADSDDDGADPTAARQQPEDYAGRIPVPRKSDLDLGASLAIRFVRQTLPDDLPTVAAFFRHSGAYRQFKELLAERGALEQWYDYEFTRDRRGAAPMVPRPQDRYFGRQHPPRQSESRSLIDAAALNASPSYI